MNEHEMCCGTTCDKQAVAAEFEKLKRERDEALAYAERLRVAWEAVKSTDWDEPMNEVINEQPSAALAALKAEWQAEVVESFLRGLNSLDTINIHNRRPDARVEWFRKRAQEAK